MFEYVNISTFRTRYKNKKQVYRNNPAADEHFIGSQHGDMSGFFLLFHGDKESIENFLRSNFQMAEDAQAVYEFIQNAADCHSTHFWLFFDDNFFLAINNGDAFTEESIKSILNIGQSHGKEKGDTIGRYGVGFKLVHRLVGRTDGLDEIVKENKGPLLFSWSRPEDFRKFIQIEAPYLGQCSEAPGAPWFLKILLTCFPIQPEEEVKGLDYQPFKPFRMHEVEECRAFTARHLDSSDLIELNQGSLFFLRLGEGKAGILSRETGDLMNGAGVSFRFLKNLKRITLNGKEIAHSNLQWLPPAILQPESPEFIAFGITDNKTKDWPAVIEIGMLPFKDAGDQIRRAPNFYKFFPLGDEVNGLNFVVHCNVFAHETNRRKLHDQSTNHRILEYTSKHIINIACEASDELYLEIFANVLLSEPPEAAGKNWQRPFLYDPLLKFFNSYCPAKNISGDCIRISAENIAIKKTHLPVHPNQWGIEKNWFFWPAHDITIKELIQEVKNEDKIGLKTWGLKELLLKGHPEVIKTWLLFQWRQETAKDVHNILFQEIAKISDNDWLDNNKFLFNRVASLPIFPFTDGQYYSANEIAVNPNLLSLKANVTQNYASVLTKIGFTVSTHPLDDTCDFYRHTAIHVGIADTKKYFDKIVAKLKDRIETGTLDINLGERWDLFLCLRNIDNDTKRLRDLVLFYNRKGKVCSLRNMISPGKGGVHFADYELDVKNAFVIQQGLAEYLCAEKEVFHNVIQEFWLEIIQAQQPEQVTSFLQQTIDYYEQDEQKYNRTLSNQGIIFLDTPRGWYLSGSVFFHKEIAELTPEKFRLADRAARALFGQSLSRPEWARLLVSPPFKVADTPLQNFANRFCSASLDFAETRAIIELLKACSQDFFASFYVDEDNGLASISPRTDKGIQFISENSKLISFVKESLPDRIKLPNELADLGKDTPMIKYGSDLEEWIVRILALLEKIDQHANQLASILTTKSAAEIYLQKIQSFQLPEREQYNIDDPDLAWLHLALNHFDEHDFPKWRQKIHIQPIQISDYTLEHAPASDTFKVDKYQLRLSQLFPNDQQQGANATSQRILSKLKKAGFSNEKLDLLFDAEKSEPSEDILNGYLNRLPDNLENATQVAFYMLLSTRTSTPLPEKKAKALNGEWYPVISRWTLTPRIFINPVYLFAESYKGLDKLLKINQENPEFKFNKDSRLIYDFYWDDEGLVWFGWTEEPTPEQSLAALEYLFDLWETSSQHRFSSIDIAKFTKTLGFLPSASVWPSQFAVEQEMLPENVRHWIGSDQKRQNFLTAIGVHTLNSGVVKLRRFFTQSGVEFTEHDLKREFQYESDQHNTLLINTLKYLKGQTFSKKEHLAMFSNVLELLPVPNSFQDFPLLYVKSVNSDNEFTYYLADAVIDDAGFDEATLSSLQEVGVPNTKLFEFFSQKGFFLLDKCHYPESWHQVPTKQIRLSKPQSNWDAISKGSVEWDAPYYQAWKTSDRPDIFLHDGPIPEMVYCQPIEDEPITTLYIAQYVADNNTIYLNKEKDPIELLFNAVSDNLISSSALQELFAKKNQVEVVPQSSNKSGASPDDYFDPLDQSPNWIGLESQQQKEINDEAKRQAAAWLRDKGYIVPEPLQTDYYRLRNIRNKEGEPVAVHVRSARGGNLYMSPMDWSELGESGALLLVVLPGGRISSITFDELMQSNGRINLQFDARTFNPEGLVLFAKLFHYVPGVKFVIQAPSFSASEYIRSFGLHERINEAISSAPTNLID